MTASLEISQDPRGIVTLTLNRPEVHNPFDASLIAALTDHLQRLDADATVRVVILSGAGKSFSAGADLNWMRSTANYDRERNLEDAEKLAEMMSLLNRLSKPTIARINGPAYGGGLGLIACCDIAIAVQSARFALTEVRLGLVPAVISPYVIACIGQRQARRFFLTAEPISATQAARIGLVHEVVAEEGLDAALERTVGLLLQAGPHALAHCKELIGTVYRDQNLSDALAFHTAELISELRVSAEGQEGLTAFLEKRPPYWRSK